MNVITFPPRPPREPRPWDAKELELLVAVHDEGAAHGNACAWDVGATELNDPQFYIVGPGPDLDCLLVVSRVGSTYVLENGRGQVLGESRSLQTIAERASAAMVVTRVGLMNGLIVGFVAARTAVEERWELMLAESEDILLRVAPQLATMV